MAKDLSAAQCVLLTVHLASEGNLDALRTFTPTRLDALDPELILRILLTYLPETTDPKEYTTYVGEVASRLYLDVDREDVHIDSSPVKDIPDAQAQKKVKKLHLFEIAPPDFPPSAPNDLLTSFLCHRAYRIDTETGLLNLVPALIEPHLDRNEYIRTWYISTVLPLLRLSFDFYPGEDTTLSLSDFENITGEAGIELLLRPAETHSTETEGTLGRDLRGLVGPWMYGRTERKRRKLVHRRGDSIDLASRVTKIDLDGVTETDKTGHDWESAYKWMVHQATEHFSLITNAVEVWDGPGDVDLGGLDDGHGYLDEDTQSKLELQYAQVAFASCYAVKANTPETIEGAHSMLVRLAHLLDFEPPPDLATSVESLPKINSHTTILHESSTTSLLEPELLLEPNHPLTSPTMPTFMLLQMLVYSAYQLDGLGLPTSISNVARCIFFSDDDEQLAVLQKVLHGLTKGPRKDEDHWVSARARLLWLWNWGIDPDDEAAQKGAGMLGSIDREVFEEEMLKCFTETSCYNLAISTFIKPANGPSRLPLQTIGKAVLAVAMDAYDNASNGNRTRGGVKKANDIITAFKSYFPSSVSFRQASALISATHALSYYSLTLHHGVPFQPVNIRVSKDALGLLSKVLEQNEHSYTKLDDLIDIGQNLVSAGLAQDAIGVGEPELDHPDDVAARKKEAERRVTSMAIEAALRENDFETAYSYIVNRLTPTAAYNATAAKSPVEGVDQRYRHFQHRSNRASNPRGDSSEIDDTSWRAAFLAGRYRSSTASPLGLRRLQQRTELLSLALLLAPVSALSEILGVWRRCEEEMTSLLASQTQDEEAFDDRADKRQSALPGNFTFEAEGPGLLLNQQRREVGRMASSRPAAGAAAGEDEAPMSMFAVARGAARAFSNNAFPLRVAARSGSGGSAPAAEGENMEGSTGTLPRHRRSGSGGSELGPEERVRKRDMVANAVSGGLASGLGWVLGATPLQQQGQARE